MAKLSIIPLRNRVKMSFSPGPVHIYEVVSAGPGVPGTTWTTLSVWVVHTCPLVELQLATSEMSSAVHSTSPDMVQMKNHQINSWDTSWTPLLPSLQRKTVYFTWKKHLIWCWWSIKEAGNSSPSGVQKVCKWANLTVLYEQLKVFF